jgi:DNA-binding NtrC family response regulator
MCFGFEAAMSDSARTLTVAVFNASDDTVEMLKALLSSRGYVAISGEVDKVKSGEIDFMAFLDTHRPDAMIWDIAPPYDRNWHFYKLVRDLRPLEHCAMVVTTTHLQHLRELTGDTVEAIEIIGKPYDLQAIVDAVERAVDDRTRSPTRVVSHRPR